MFAAPAQHGTGARTASDHTYLLQRDVDSVCWATACPLLTPRHGSCTAHRDARKAQTARLAISTQRLPPREPHHQPLILLLLTAPTSTYCVVHMYQVLVVPRRSGTVVPAGRGGGQKRSSCTASYTSPRQTQVPALRLHSAHNPFKPPSSPENLQLSKSPSPWFCECGRLRCICGYHLVLVGVPLYPYTSCEPNR